MKLLYWNIHKNENSKYINASLESGEIDFMLLSEYEGLNINKVCIKNPNYIINSASDKVLVIHKNDIEIINAFEATRYCILTTKYKGELFVLVGLHLPSNVHGGSEDRKEVIRPLICDLKSIETKFCTNNTIVIGDFNSSPFDSELTQKTLFNAVLFKKLILDKERIKYNGHFYKRFYNPMLDLISEESEQYGSHYYNTGINTLVWYCYDQVLVRKPLIDRLRSVNFCKQVSGCLLLSQNGIPRSSISDHLPLEVEVV